MLWLNIAMAVDLIVMIKYPFRPKSVTFYVLLSFASSLVVAVLNGFAYRNNYKLRPKILSIWMMFTILVYMVAATTSIIYAIKKLRRPGIS
jgi:RsiW-degrading membrane proteinase PrsW (M82 family)